MKIVNLHTNKLVKILGAGTYENCIFDLHDSHAQSSLKVKHPSILGILMGFPQQAVVSTFPNGSQNAASDFNQGNNETCGPKARSSRLKGFWASPCIKGRP